MNLQQWAIVLFPFEEEPKRGPHYMVILSNDERCQNDDLPAVNALFCRTIRARALRPNEVMLNSADGLDWETAVECDHVWSLPKADFRTQKGRVCAERQRKIARRLVECLRLQLY
jgi:mRNA-degrading endonuclease toxin of MazEF toxin-antitoxin module